jgi:hypothetical protein
MFSIQAEPLRLITWKRQYVVDGTGYVAFEERDLISIMVLIGRQKFVVFSKPLPGTGYKGNMLPFPAESSK